MNTTLFVLRTKSNLVSAKHFATPVCDVSWRKLWENSPTSTVLVCSLVHTKTPGREKRRHWDFLLLNSEQTIVVWLNSTWTVTRSEWSLVSIENVLQPVLNFPTTSGGNENQTVDKEPRSMSACCPQVSSNEEALRIVSVVISSTIYFGTGSVPEDVVVIRSQTERLITSMLNELKPAAHKACPCELPQWENYR